MKTAPPLGTLVRYLQRERGWKYGRIVEDEDDPTEFALQPLDVLREVPASTPIVEVLWLEDGMQPTGRIVSFETFPLRWNE